MARVPKTNQIDEDYEITNNVLGLGFSGRVIEVIHRATREKRALKVLPDTEKTKREVELHWRVSDCPYVVKIIDVYYNPSRDANCYLIVMECMNGGELFNRINDQSRGKFTERQAAEIMQNICQAVHYIHSRNIAHRDIKPENILYTTTAEGATLKLTDFGFAKESLGPTSLSTPCYTPYYVAPEVLGPENYDKSCDIWSLGVVMYIVLCGFPPFYSDRGVAISPGMKNRIRLGKYDFPEPEWNEISADAKNLIRGMLVVDHKKRKTIEQVMNSPWILKYTEVPVTPLYTQDTLKSSKSNWSYVDEEMTRTLATMRIDYDQVKLKNLEMSKNDLLDKRRQRNNAK